MYAIERDSPAYRGAFVLAAIVAAFDCANVKRDGKGLRYVRDWRERGYSGADLVSEFEKHALMMISDAEEAPIQSGNRASIINADSRKVVTELEDRSFDLVLTSPPYLNSADYSDIYRPELFLGGFVKSNKELAILRLKTIRSHVQVTWPGQTSVRCDLLSPILQRLKDADGLWNSRIPLMVEAYFDDLNQVVRATAPKLKQRGQMWMVVSTSAYGGVHIPVDLIIAELASDAGFAVEGIHRLRDLRSSGQQWKRLNTKRPPLRESLIMLTKV
jgi:hypothetical protein